MKIKRGHILPFLILLLGAITMITPFVWMLSTSLKESRLVYQIPPKWIPDPVDWANYKEVWTSSNLLVGFRNSIFVTATVIVCCTITSSMAAFAFAKLIFPGKGMYFLALLSTMMVPGVVLLIPQFMMYTKLSWIDTFYPLIIPASLGNVSMIFFLRQYMTGLSSELIDAAKIDGCSYPRVYAQIFMPLCRPAIAANTIILFMGTWNDYLGPTIFTNSRSLQTVQVAVASLNSYYAEQTDVPVVMAASLLSVIPVLLLFTVCQKYFTESFAMTGIKG